MLNKSQRNQRHRLMRQLFRINDRRLFCTCAFLVLPRGASCCHRLERYAEHDITPDLKPGHVVVLLSSSMIITRRNHICLESPSSLSLIYRFFTAHDLFFCNETLTAVVG